MFEGKYKDYTVKHDPEGYSPYSADIDGSIIYGKDWASLKRKIDNALKQDIKRVSVFVVGIMNWRVKPGIVTSITEDGQSCWVSYTDKGAWPKRSKEQFSSVILNNEKNIELLAELERLDGVIEDTRTLMRETARNFDYFRKEEK